jgi:hypothetical protein
VEKESGIDPKANSELTVVRKKLKKGVIQEATGGKILVALAFAFLPANYDFTHPRLSSSRPKRA